MTMTTSAAICSLSLMALGCAGPGTPVSPSSPANLFKGHSLEYTSGTTACEGYVSLPRTPGKHPAVLVIHDWDSINDHEKSVADRLADMGYVALCADFYGKGVRPTTQAECAELAGKYKADPTLFRTRLEDALVALRALPEVNPRKIAAIGYCVGGTGALELARADADVLGVVSFHGGLDPAPGFEAKKVKTRVLVLHGEDDPFAPKSQVLDLEKEFAAAGCKVKVEMYPGAVHGFTVKANGDNPNSGLAYNKSADEKSWAAMRDFLASLFQ